MLETDLEWLDYRLRSIHRIRSNGQREDDEMLVCHMALDGHFTVEMKVGSLQELVEKGRKFERENLRVKDN